MQNSLCVQVVRYPILAALLQGTRAAGLSQTSQGVTFTRQGSHPVRHWAVELSNSFFPRLLSGRRLDVNHTSTHAMALVRIQNAGLKCAARGSLKIQDAKIRHLLTIAQPSLAIHN